LDALKPQNSKEKGSRIDNAVKKMREAQREKSEKDCEMTSKSRILEQMQMKSVKLEVMQM